MLPESLTEEAVAKMLWDAQRPDADRIEWGRLDRVSKDGWLRMARAVLALVREKVREAVVEGIEQAVGWTHRLGIDAIVSRVLGDHPQGGHDEGRPARGEAPRA